MSKLPRELEDPIDNIFLSTAKPVFPIYRSLHMIPNDITLLSFICGLLSIYYYRKKKYIECTLLLLISYTFDCHDGLYARTYNMVSKFGDFFDHVKDWFVLSILTYNIYKTYDGIDKGKHIICLFILGSLLNGVHYGCQEKYYNKNETPTLQLTKSLCPKHTKQQIISALKYTRYFGGGIMMIWYSIIILYPLLNKELFK
jgi:hypothetical protein